MAAVPVTISGVLYDKQARTQQSVTLIGEASYTGVGVGGGPIMPPSGGGEPPLGIWGPTDPRPTPPIVIPEPPGGGPPLVIWGGGNEPFPTPPIVIPMPPLPDPPHPEHPIVIPPEQPPDGGEPPLGIWGPLPGFPTPPIVIPPNPPQRLVTWHVAWTPQTGWIVVGTPNVPHPAPSK